MKPSISKRIILDELFKAAFWSFVGHHHQTSMVKLDHHHWSEPLVTRISDQVLGYVFLWSRSLLRVLGSQLWLSPCLEIQKTFFLSISLSREGNPENQHLLQFVFSSMTFLFSFCKRFHFIDSFHLDTTLRVPLWIYSPIFVLFLRFSYSRSTWKLQKSPEEEEKITHRTSKIKTKKKKDFLNIWIPKRGLKSWGLLKRHYIYFMKVYYFPNMHMALAIQKEKRKRS